MRNKILENIKTGLLANVGPDSDYEDYQVEDVQNTLPEKTLVNRFIGMIIDRANTLGVEIGKKHPTRLEYIVSIVVLIKNADYDKGQTELDTIVRRVIKYFANDTGSLLPLSNTTDGVTENVVNYRIENLDYTDGKLKAGSLGHICFITLAVSTELII